MSFYGNKRRRHHHQRPTQDSRPKTEFKFDYELYKLNYAASERLRSRILSEFCLESHELPPSTYKNTYRLQVVSQTWKPKTFSTPRCFYCSLKHNFANNIISQSSSVSLILDSLKNCVLEDQLLLVPNSHVQNTLYLDDTSYTEIRNYQKTLVHMFHQLNKCVVFVEMSINDKNLKDSENGSDRIVKSNTYEQDYFEKKGNQPPNQYQMKDVFSNESQSSHVYSDQYKACDKYNDHRVKDRRNTPQKLHNRATGHCKIECYPIPLDHFDEARCYFTKALDEMGPAWSQNKKMPITGKTGVRGSIPQGFDYIHVDFSLSGEAVAYVIDNPAELRYSFGRSIVAGILNMDQLERAFRDGEEYNRGINNIRRLYKDFDWTATS